MRLPALSRLILATLVAGTVTPALALDADRPLLLAQLFNRPSAPPADIDDDAPAPRGGGDAAGLVVRLDRAENQMRSMTGQIEQLQFQVRKLEEQLRKAQADAEFRAQEQKGVPARPIAAAPQTVPPVVATPSLPVGDTTPGTRLRRSDAFNPDIAPGAPGAPRQLGTVPDNSTVASQQPPATRLPGGPVGEDNSMRPMDLGSNRVRTPDATGIAAAPLPPSGSAIPPAANQSMPGAQQVTPGGTIIASTGPAGPKEDYDLAVSYLRQGQYEAAEKGFSTYIAKYPKARSVPDAVFNLGESYFQRSRHREAAEQYLKISTTYSSSPKGAEAMLRLGQSLNALGAKEQACASFAEVTRKYPNASANIRGAADRETKKNSC